MKKTFEQENKELFKDFLERYYFIYWRNPETQHDVPEDIFGRGLELYPTSACNTSCTYCYLKNFDGETFYDKASQRPANVLENTKQLLDWFIKEDLRPGGLEVFSGDIFSQNALWEPYFDLLYDFICRVRDPEGLSISIPTNATWIKNEDTVHKIEKNIIERFANKGVHASFSMSIDGGPLDNYSRPFKNPSMQYTEDMYKRIFEFCVRHGYGTHPMLSAHNVHDWVENFKWFVQKWQEVGMSKKEAIDRTYILEVRNPDWKPEDLKALHTFIMEIGHYIFEDIYEGNLRDFYHEIVEENRGNFFGAISGTVARGMPCSIETSFPVRADNKLISCHRLGFQGYEGGKFVSDGEKIVDIEPINPDSFMASRFFEFATGLQCNHCPIRYICGGFCLGANYEMTGEQYLPVPTVCRMEMVKVKALTELYRDIGVLEPLINTFRHSSPLNFRMIGCYDYVLNTEFSFDSMYDSTELDNNKE